MHLGATLGKGLNRAMATLVAGALGIGAHHLASLSGQIGEPIVIGVFVFLQGILLTLKQTSILSFFSLNKSLCFCSCDINIYTIFSQNQGTI